MEAASIACAAGLGQCARVEAGMIFAIAVLAGSLVSSQMLENGKGNSSGAKAPAMGAVTMSELKLRPPREPFAAAGVGAAHAAQEGFDKYVASAEERIRREESSADAFLETPASTAAERAEKEARLRRGEIVIERVGTGPHEVSGALIHHWTGVVFIPKATTADVMKVVQDYDHLVRYYSPEVVSSRLVARNGDDFQIAMRLREHEVITVVLDTEYRVQYGRLDAEHLYSFSRSTRVAEIANAGEPGEHALADGDGHGFLWRLNAYWRFVQANDGVFVECEAISLTRNVPTGLGWLVGPFIQGIPRDSLRTTLVDTRKAVEEERK